MVEKDLTPAGVLFDAMKRFAGVSHAETAALVLSGRPLADGRSPISRATDDPTWLSRYVVHAPMETVQAQYFAEPSLSAMRLIARLKSSKLKRSGSRDILQLLEESICPRMAASLEHHGQNAQICMNALARFSAAEGMSHSEREEVAMVLFVATAVYGNVKRSVEYTYAYAKQAWGALADRTPAPETLPSAASEVAAVYSIGLMRIDDGYTMGAPIWLEPEFGSIEVGAMAFGEHDIADVTPSVSAHHARIACGANGVWMVEDLGSSNGTVVVSGADASERICAPGVPQELAPGDELRLATETRFIVLAG